MLFCSPHTHISKKEEENGGYFHMHTHLKEGRRKLVFSYAQSDSLLSFKLVFLLF